MIDQGVTASGSTKTPPVGGTGPRILVVDHDPEVRSALCSRFRADGFLVTAAADGASALQHLRGERPDLIVLDVAMPALDGWSVLGKLAAIVAAPPVIVMSATAHSLAAARAYALGACDFLVKPCDPGQVVARARRAAEQYAVVA